MKHTPGPWDQAANKVQILEYNGGKGPYRLIAEAWHGVQITGSGNSGIDREEAEANARLIAAAPELLEACKELDAALRKAWREQILPYGVISGDLAAKVTTAVAKAEGKP